MDESLSKFLRRLIYQKGNYPGQPDWQLWTLDYELIHKLVLKSLIDDSREFLPDLVQPAREARDCLTEPSGGLYDLKIATKSEIAFVEIKVWSRLYSHQIKRQVGGLNGSNCHLFYLLLGRTGADWSCRHIEEETNGRAKKISYGYLIAALEPLVPLVPLAAAYKSALSEQLARIKEFGDPDL